MFSGISDGVALPVLPLFPSSLFSGISDGVAFPLPLFSGISEGVAFPLPLLSSLKFNDILLTLLSVIPASTSSV